MKKRKETVDEATNDLSTTMEYEVQACVESCLYPCVVHAHDWDKCTIVDQNVTHATVRIAADQSVIQNVHKRYIREVGSGTSGPRASRSRRPT